MTVLVFATCSLCGTRMTGVGLRTGDEHRDGRCAAPIVVDRAWSLPPLRDGGPAGPAADHTTRPTPGTRVTP